MYRLIGHWKASRAFQITKARPPQSSKHKSPARHLFSARCIHCYTYTSIPLLLLPSLVSPWEELIYPLSVFAFCMLVVVALAVQSGWNAGNFVDWITDLSQ